MPGAFTGTCNAQVPGYINAFNQFKEKGVNGIYIIAVNDVFVTKYVPLNLSSFFYHTISEHGKTNLHLMAQVSFCIFDARIIHAYPSQRSISSRMTPQHSRMPSVSLLTRVLSSEMFAQRYISSSSHRL